MKYLRIKKNADFQKLFNKGKKVFSPNITLLYFSAKKLSMGVAVSKKHGKAVKRNRIKRLLRAAFRDTCDLLERPYSVILIPKVGGEYTFEAFKRSLNTCFKKVNECGKT
ncbi:MAG: ribonuclease P protein component [Clostridia bacterium]|nr:ribonuclease P protein component [Clostridia bacterium]